MPLLSNNRISQTQVMPTFAETVIAWQKVYGRHHLPWQRGHHPYTVWLAEIMLQQTQVNTVIPYFQRFLRQFPDIASLAQAPLDDVLALWSGLGYYSRARNLHRAAGLVVEIHQGVFPNRRDQIAQLPGIGRSTAAAIMVFAFGQRAAILDGNVKRVFARYFGIAGYPGEAKTKAQLWRLAETQLPGKGVAADIKAYTQGLMDLGALVCIRRKPLCSACPLQQSCTAYREGCIESLPAAKPRKQLPERQTDFMIYTLGEALLLQRRPDKGVWGGLWCFPEQPVFTGSGEVHEHAAQIVSLPQLAHTFTHFKLWITPRLITLTEATETPDARITWVKPEAALELAIPTPVRKLIQQHLLN